MTFDVDYNNDSASTFGNETPLKIIVCHRFNGSQHGRHLLADEFKECRQKSVLQSTLKRCVNEFCKIGI